MEDSYRSVPANVAAQRRILVQPQVRARLVVIRRSSRRQFFADCTIATRGRDFREGQYAQPLRRGAERAMGGEPVFLPRTHYGGRLCGLWCL